MCSFVFVSAMQSRFFQEPIQLGRQEWALLIREPAIFPIFEALARLDNEESVPVPHSLKLKTKVYQRVKGEDHLPPPAKKKADDPINEAKSDIEAHEADPMDHMEEPSCTICYLSIDDGDRVGALECDHVFHVDCLKTWLTRRNVCPLCLMENVATPQYDAEDSPGSQSGQNGAGPSEADETGHG
jgi:Ring finger domain